MAYVSVDDVDAAVERAKGMGGREAWPATDIPNVGRFAVISDPQGGHISPWKSLQEDEDEAQPGPGEFCWEEFLAKDPAEAARFYGELFGWKTEEMDMGEMGTYTLLKRGDRGVADILKMPAEVKAPSHWLSYVMVEDVDASVRKIEELGGTVCKPGTDIPDIGRFAVATDPAGAVFAVWKSQH
jgi:predicted enzyme related to lactoylglutathione lyase